MIRSYYSTI